MILGNTLSKLTAENREPSTTPGVNLYSTKPQYVCVRCQQTNPGFKGMVKRGPGLGYCKEHNPK